MNAKTTILTLAAVGSLALPATGDDFRWSGDMAAGRTLEIRGVNGDVSARGGRGPALVEAVKTARKGDPEAVKIEVVEEADRVIVCAVYPNARVGRHACDVRGHEGGRWQREHDVRVRFTVTVPEGVRFEGATVNGDIVATGLTADAEVTTVNGSVELQTAGEGRATTVNGAVDVKLGRTDGRGGLQFTTVNGDVSVTVPDGLGAELEASTVNGSIETDFPVTVRGKLGKRHLRGQIGGGGRELRLETVNGDIAIRKG